ncbi:hypothetical protein ACKKBF_B21850 [Auxenochlorella protothecoides x Auxenochlorella symbiontica]
MPLRTVRSTCSRAALHLTRIVLDRTVTGLETCITVLCETPTPAVQGLFVLLFGAAFYSYCKYFFSLLPLPTVPAWHIWSGTLTMMPSLVFFVLASWTDPGVVTPENVEQYNRQYRLDGVLYQPRTCATCNIPKPARSKHCRVCNRCIGRMDHHCIWLNTCIGTRNLRWFLAFLASTAAICIYGARGGWRVASACEVSGPGPLLSGQAVPGDVLRVTHTWSACRVCDRLCPSQPARSSTLAPQGAVLGARIMHGHMGVEGAWKLARVRRGSGRLEYVSDSALTTLRYVLERYPVQFCLTFFLGVMGWVLTGFLGYHIFLILSGTTTNEASKWRALRKDLARQAAFDPAGLHLDLAPDNAYDWGPGRNLLDALVPRVPCTKDSKLC